MQELIENVIKREYPTYYVFGYEESEYRGYLYFNTGEGSKLAVMSRLKEEISIYDFHKRTVII